MINDIEDNYSEYLNDTTGYAWDAWDILTQAEISDHDEILAGSKADAFDLKDLGIWASCRRLFLDGNIEAFIELGRTLFENKKTQSPALVYPEIAALISNMMIKEGQFDLVGVFLSARQKDYPGNVDLKISEFILKASKGEDTNTDLEKIGDVELLFDITEGLLTAGFIDAAKSCFSVCRDKVGNKPLSAIHVDLDSMNRKLKKL